MGYWAQGVGKERESAPCSAKVGLAATRSATVCSAPAPRSAGASQIGQESQARARMTTIVEAAGDDIWNRRRSRDKPAKDRVKLARTREMRVHSTVSMELSKMQLIQTEAIPQT